MYFLPARNDCSHAVYKGREDFLSTKLVAVPWWAVVRIDNVRKHFSYRTRRDGIDWIDALDWKGPPE
jgi:hypothetical protein